MTLKTCLRCDWQGETRDPVCPTCGVQPLYVLGASARKGAGTPVRGHAVDRSREAANTTTTMAPPAPRSPQSSPSAPAADAEGPSSTRSGRSPLAFALAALVLIVILGTWLKTQEERPAPAASTDAVEQGRPLESVGLLPQDVSPSPFPSEGVPIEGSLIDKRATVTVQGVSFSFKVPTSGWEIHGGTYISKSTVGPQGAEAMIYWTSIADGPLIEPCGQWWGSPVGSLADYAVSASSMRGTEVVTEPSDVTIGGRAAKLVVFTVRQDLGCKPGFFYTWREGNPGGAFWTKTHVGDTIRVWLVDVDGERLFIEGDTNKAAGSALEQEIQQIVDSIRFR